MSRAERGRARTLDRVDLDENRVVRRAFAHQRRDRRVAGVAAVPIGLAVDLHRLEQGRQAGRGEQRVRRDRGVAEHAAPAGAHAGGGDEQLDRCARQPVEVDGLGQDPAQGIGAARIEVVGREQARGEVHRDEGRGVVERPAAEHDVERRAAQRAEERRLGHAAPKSFQRSAGALGAACGMTVGQHRRVHGAGRRAGDAVDPQPGSSSSRSSTPQVNAPCAPPPCSARSMRTGSRDMSASRSFRGRCPSLPGLSRVAGAAAIVGRSRSR